MTMVSRNLSIVFDGLEITQPMKITVTVTRDGMSEEPDFADIKIQNLTEDTRSKISTEYKKLSIYAGHGTRSELVFTGDIQSVTSRHDRTEWITTILAGDGATVMRQAIMNKAYKSPISARALIEDIGKTSGIADGKVEFIDIPTKTDALTSVTLTSTARDELTRITEPRGWTWNIQNDKLVVAAAQKSRKAVSYKIDTESGMIGSPEWVNTGMKIDGDSKEKLRVRVKVLCLPSIKPKDKIKITTKALEGRIGSFTFIREREHVLDDFFTVERVIQNLDTRDGDFSTSIEATIQREK